MARLTWNGSLDAQQQADIAFASLKDRTPAKKRRQRSPEQNRLRRKRRAKERKDWCIGMPYRLYMQSDWWKARRKRAISLSGYKCHKCGAREYLRVHHLTYDNVGAEKDEDLQVLCKDCHDAIHAGRRRA